jgi:hypothetical protein
VARFDFVYGSGIKKLYRLMSMDAIKFIPQSQQRVDMAVTQKKQSSGQALIIVLIVLFVVYSAIVGSVYTLLVMRVQSNLTQSIAELDAVNESYYPKDVSLSDSLFNLKKIISDFYDPTAVIKPIESSYIANARVDGFSYNKNNKTINISLVTTSLNDVTEQISKFKALDGVSEADFSSTNLVGESSGVSSVITIILK